MHTISFLKRYINTVRFASFADPEDEIRDKWFEE